MQSGRPVAIARPTTTHRERLTQMPSLKKDNRKINTAGAWIPQTDWLANNSEDKNNGVYGLESVRPDASRL